MVFDAEKFADTFYMEWFKSHTPQIVVQKKWIYDMAQAAYDQGRDDEAWKIKSVLEAINAEGMESFQSRTVLQPDSDIGLIVDLARRAMKMVWEKEAAAKAYGDAVRKDIEIIKDLQKQVGARDEALGVAKEVMEQSLIRGGPEQFREVLRAIAAVKGEG